MAIVNKCKETINKRAFSRYISQKRNFLSRLALSERLRKDDLTWCDESTKYHFGDSEIRIHAKQTPDGYANFRRKREAVFSTRHEEKNEAEAPLVLPAKSQSHFLPVIDPNTGEIQDFTQQTKDLTFTPVYDESIARAERYALQSEARHILKDIRKTNDRGQSVPEYRVCDCLRNPVSGAGTVSVVKTRLNEGARFSGLQTCGSVWHCPVCSNRISEMRRQELRQMVDIWQQCGKGVIFLTNTIRHEKHDDLRVLLEVFTGIIWNRYINHRTYKNLRKKLGYIGRVRSIEVTYGDANGWHPHVHEIWLIEKPLTQAELDKVRDQLYKVWNKTLTNAGMPSVSKKRGITVQNGSNAIDYITKFGRQPKWDIGHELTKGHSKKAHGKGSSPFDLLRRSISGDKHASALFREYAIAFAGKRQLYYSTGLKDYFLVGVKSDEELAVDASNDLKVLATLSRTDWRYVLVFGDRYTLLSICLNGTPEDITSYLHNLRQKGVLCNTFGMQKTLDGFV